jgi:transcriptional regulator with XRE-family HTH domain
MAAWSEQIHQCRRDRGLTQEEFAREVARVAWERLHVQVGIDAAMVSKWERGTKLPSKRYQRLLGALFNADAPAGPTLHPAADLGFDYAGPPTATLDDVDRVGRADMERRDFLRGALFTVGLSIAPSRDWLVTTIEDATAPAGRVGASQVDAIRRTFGLFQEMDVMRLGATPATNSRAMSRRSSPHCYERTTPQPPPAERSTRLGLSSSTCSGGWPTTTANMPWPSATSSRR